MIVWLSVIYDDKAPMLKGTQCSHSCELVLRSPSAGGCEEAVYLPLRPHTCPTSPSLVTHIYVVITVQCVLLSPTGTYVCIEYSLCNYIIQTKKEMPMMQ